jgi:hypothetical protein
VSTEPIRAERDERCMDASRSNETRRAMLARAGVGAGTLALLGLAQPARAATTRFDDTVEVVPTAGNAALRLACSGSVPYSAVSGGALNLDNTGSTGAGAVLYSNRGADALGRLLTVNQANPANPQHALRVQNAGTAHTVSIYHDPAAGAGDPSAEALDVVSTNEQDTAVGVRGRETGKGTVKITHSKPGASDADASALSIALEGAGTACQGIYIGNDADNPTTGDLLHIRNGGPGAERLRLTAPGRLELAAQGAGGGLQIGGDTHLYRAETQVLATDGALRVACVVTSAAGKSPVLSGIQHQPQLQSIASGGSGHVDKLFGFHAAPTAKVGAGWTVASYSMLRIEPPAGSGAIQSLTGLDIRDFGNRAASNYSVRSFGADVHMRHSGGIGIGSQATPDTLLHLRGNQSFHGSVTLDQESADPPAPAAQTQARLYVKNGKLVVQWNDGTRTLFTTIPLAPPGPYPVSSQATTDTVPP